MRLSEFSPSKGTHVTNGQMKDRTGPDPKALSRLFSVTTPPTCNNKAQYTCY